MNELQGTFEFSDISEKISFESFSGKCTCGREYNSKRCSIALEMTIVCPACGNIIRIGEIKKADI